MKHFGIVSPPVSGHLNPFCAIGRELVRRGHRVTVFHMSDVGPKVRSEQLEFTAIGEADHPPGTLAATLGRIGSLSGLAAMRYTVQAAARSSEMFLRDLPDAVRPAGVNALLVDQMEPAGSTVAERLGLPFITVCNALALNRDDTIPPPFADFAYSKGWFSRLRNRVGYTIGRQAVRPITEAVNRYRRKWGLKAYQESDDSFSRLAQLSQQAPAFDFPRSNLPNGFHYLGPFRDSHHDRSQFPWGRLDGKPLVYASLGSMQGSKLDLLRKFALACTEVDLQAVITHGGALSPEEASKIPGNHVVVSYAPQSAVIQRARLTLTHAGLNTVLDSLTYGVPLVAVPLTYEQPAIARRIEWVGAGETLSLSSVSVSRLVGTLRKVLEHDDYKQSADAVRESISQAGGTVRAVTVIEKLLC